MDRAAYGASVPAADRGGQRVRFVSKIDRNQPEIVAALRKCGASVCITSAVGHGYPDLNVGYRGRTILMEIKDGELPPSARQLTPDQRVWHANWHGSPVVVVNSVAEALNALEAA